MEDLQVKHARQWLAMAMQEGVCESEKAVRLQRLKEVLDDADGVYAEDRASALELAIRLGRNAA